MNRKEGQEIEIQRERDPRESENEEGVDDTRETKICLLSLFFFSFVFVVIIF
jgi:hypothetical protein